MRHRRIFAAVGLVAAASLALSGCARGGGAAGGGDDDSYTIAIGHSPPADTPVNLGSLQFKEIVEEETEGRVTVEVYPAEELGSEPEMVEGLSLGNVQVALVATAVAADTCPALGLFALPYIIEGENDEEQYESLAKLAESDLNQEIIAECREESGLYVVDNAWWYGNRHLTTNVEINEPADMQGLIIRTPPADLHTMGIEAFGAETVPMPMSELYSALDTGVVDGQENPINTIYQNAMYEVQSNLAFTKHMTQNQALLMDAEWFETLSEADQELIERAIREAGQYQSELQLENTDADLEELESEGMEVNEPDLAPFVELTEEPVAEHLDALGFSREDIIAAQQ